MNITAQRTVFSETDQVNLTLIEATGVVSAFFGKYGSQSDSVISSKISPIIAEWDTITRSLLETISQQSSQLENSSLAIADSNNHLRKVTAHFVCLYFQMKNFLYERLLPMLLYNTIKNGDTKNLFPKSVFRQGTEIKASLNTFTIEYLCYTISQSKTLPFLKNEAIKSLFKLLSRKYKANTGKDRFVLKHPKSYSHRSEENIHHKGTNRLSFTPTPPPELLLSSVFYSAFSSNEVLDSIVAECRSLDKDEEFLNRSTSLLHLLSLTRSTMCSTSKVDPDLLLTPVEAWDYCVRIGALCDVGNAKDLAPLLQSLTERFLMVFFRLFDHSQNLLHSSKNNPLSWSRSKFDAGWWGGSLKGFACPFDERLPLMAAALPLQSLFLTHSFFIPPFTRTDSTSSLSVLIPGSAITFNKLKEIPVKKQTNLSESIFFMAGLNNQENSLVWLPPSKALFTPLISLTKREQIFKYISPDCRIEEDITTFGSPAGLHDRLIVPHSITPMVAVSTAWALKIPEVLIEGTVKAPSAPAYTSRETTAKKISRKIRLLRKSQTNKKTLIDKFLHKPELPLHIQDIVEICCFKYPTSFFEEVTKSSPTCDELFPLNEVVIQEYIHEYVRCAPPFSYDKNIRLLVLFHYLKLQHELKTRPTSSVETTPLPDETISAQSLLHFSLAALLDEAPTRFIDYFTSQNTFSNEYIKSALDLPILAKSLWEKAQYIENNPVYPPPFHRPTKDSTKLSLYRPLSEHLSLYGYSHEGSAIIAARALKIIKT
jgi:hypothetical protein